MILLFYGAHQNVVDFCSYKFSFLSFLVKKEKKHEKKEQPQHC